VILAASLAIGGALSILAGLVSLCIHMTRQPPRNRYVKRPPSRDCARFPDWRSAERIR
jgi:hypothetical protein